MSKKIITIGLSLASDSVTYEDFASKGSLLDWDITLFKPVISDFIAYAEQYKGKPSLNERQSFALKEACEHWRREIKQAVEAGKTVIVFLPAVEEVYIDTGERQYSGTGRNRATTRIVSLYSNYSCIPVSLKPTNSKGSLVKLAPKGAEVLAPYWSEFASKSEYQTLLSDLDLKPALLTRNGDKAVGAIIPSKNTNGTLVCLPDIDFYDSSFLKDAEEDAESEEHLWSEVAEQFAAKLISSVISLDMSLRNAGEVTPEPSWASEKHYALDSEKELQARLLETEAQLEDAQRKKESLIEELTSVGRLRGLLYEKGKPLELAIINSLNILGFSAISFKEGNSEFDVIFESSEGRLIGEAEGKDNKAINVDKLRQLAMNINEDLLREEVTTPAKGVLFGNGYRLTTPNERPVEFTEKCILAANSSGTALISTQELFKAAKYVLDSSNSSFAELCRNTILSQSGIVSLSKTLPLSSIQTETIETVSTT